VTGESQGHHRSARTSYLLLLALLAAGFATAFNASRTFAAEDAKKGERPNIVFILADDYGIDGVGAYGSDRFKGKTPNIDSLAVTGMRFDRCFASPVCGPSRVMFITGRYAFRTGGLSHGAGSVPGVSSKVEPSIAKMMKSAGYVTGMVGKWRQMGELAGDWGFGEYLMSDDSASPTRIYGYFENGTHKKKPQDAYYPDIPHAFALEFLRRNREKPFFLYYASHLVHDPIEATPDSKPGETNREQLYDDNVQYLDKQVGEVISEIEKLGLRERTLIVFSTDNGTDHGNSTIGGRKLSGEKREMLEGGANVPLIASWKGTTPAGKISKDLVNLTDMLATFAELAGAQLPEGVKFDSHSFAPQLRGEKGTPREWAYVQLFHNMDWKKYPAGHYYVRGDRWKLNQDGELFDMKDAPFTEPLVPADSTDPEATAGRKRLAAVLAELNPRGGKLEPKPAPKKNANAAGK
jgi:arylsulfatase A